MKILLQTIVIFALSCFVFSAKAQTIFVAQNATGNGTSWSSATGNLKTALENAAPGTEIWVKQGTYRPASCTNCTFNDRNQYFQIPSSVKLYGGFAGTENNIGQRNIAAHPTYLSGDIDSDGTLAHNSFTVIFTHNVNVETMVDGFVITGGNADQSMAGLGTPPSSGAGWFNLGSTNGSSSHPTIANCTFSNNFAWGYGGGMFNDGSFTGSCNPKLTNCIFSNNISVNGGGGLYSSGNFNGQSSPVLVGCIFENNECQQSEGGGMFNIGAEGGVSNPELTNCSFTGNTAFHDGGAMYNFGKGGTCNPVVRDCLFENNEGIGGGAVYNDGTFMGYCGAVFNNCIFKQNHSYDGDGGAMYNSGYQGTCNPELVHCLFENNNSRYAGGAVFNNGVEGTCNPSITNCRFVGNTADTYGGSMYNQGKTGTASPSLTNCIFYNNSALSAGAVYNLGADNGNANAMITNCTFFGNHANVGGAVYCNAGEGGTGTASPTLRNCIFWGNHANDEGDVFRIIWGTPTISYSLADKANCNGLYNGNGGSVNCGAGMVYNQNPMFVSPASGNFHLMSNSPAIDGGSNTAINQANVSVDLDSLPRIFNGTVDMGVFEFGSMAGDAPVFTQNPQSQAVCAGGTATFSVSATGGQPLTYQWLKNGNEIPGETNEVLAIPDVNASHAGNYSCQVTSSTNATVTSSIAVLTVNQPGQVSIMITASQEEICEGEEVTFTALPVNGGADPFYQWNINNNLLATHAPQIALGSLNNGDVVACELVSSATCVVNSYAVSNSVSIAVENVQTAALSIASGQAVICEGQPALFTASPVNGGDSPAYAWSVNGNPAGNNSPSLTLAALQSGDQITCLMTSSKTCVAVNPVESNMLTVEVTANEVASIAITPSVDSAFCLGTEVVFTATVEHGGLSPVYQWWVNGSDVNNNSPEYTTNGLMDGDEVVCSLTSAEICLLENPVASNSVIVEVDSCETAAREQIVDKQLVFVYPNPTDGKFFVDFSKSTGNFALRLLNTTGQIVLSTFENHPVIPFKRELDVSHFPKGIYYLQIISNWYTQTEKLVVQ
ncbi:MAG: immunoglobulin domain-containing protein [Lewinellaceae bacterium]|nr:immunoglobulin domain-containing protein [Saprospiraceae bacterium]MCB9338372.1 immunoglobulin domain-containing protein [Lewinellaceae bacterium]